MRGCMLASYRLSTWPNWQHSCSLSYKLTHSPRPFNSFSNSPLFLHTDFWRKDVTTIKVRGCCFPGNSTRSTQSPLELACYVPWYYHPSLRGHKLWQQLNILWKVWAALLWVCTQLTNEPITIYQSIILSVGLKHYKLTLELTAHLIIWLNFVGAEAIIGAVIDPTHDLVILCLVHLYENVHAFNREKS